MHTSVIDTALPLFDIPADDDQIDDDYTLQPEIEQIEIKDQLKQPLTITEHTGIKAQLDAKGIILDNLTFLEPDLCTLDDWHNEVDMMTDPTNNAPSREIDKAIISLLTNMEPNEHFLTAASNYVSNPRAWNEFLRDPFVKESCRCLGINEKMLHPRTLESFRRDHADVVPELVANVRYQAYERERQECIALILQAQPLIQAKNDFSTPIPHQKKPGKKKHILRPLPHVEEPKRGMKDRSERMELIRQAKQLENTERWKQTRQSIEKAATRRSEAIQRKELSFKKKDFEAEVKRKNKAANNEQENRRKIIMKNLINEKKPFDFKSTSKEECNLVYEIHKIELNEHQERAERIKRAKEYQKIKLAQHSKAIHFNYK